MSNKLPSEIWSQPKTKKLIVNNVLVTLSNLPDFVGPQRAI